MMSKPDAQTTYSLLELRLILKGLSTNLLKSASKIKDLLGFQITLLEIFKYESKRFDALGYCDVSMAFVAHAANVYLATSLSTSASQEVKPILKQITEQLQNNKTKFAAIEQKLERLSVLQQVNSDAADPLLMRFANLKTGVLEAPVASSFEGFLYSDSLSVYELNHLIRSRADDVLLLDFRSKKEHSYSHINFLNVVNIEPSKVTALLKDKPQATDKDLEKALSLDSESLQLFQNRQKFGLIVAYNLRFGGIGNDKFQALEFLLLNSDSKGIPSKNPFKDLFDILMYKTEYLSSRPQQYPVYLNGGLERWYSTFGEGSLTRSSDTSLEKPKANGNSSTNGSAKASDSAYVRNFGDYLASAKSKTPPLTSSRTSLDRQRKTDIDFSSSRPRQPPSYESLKPNTAPVPIERKAPPSIKPSSPVPSVSKQSQTKVEKQVTSPSNQELQVQKTGSSETNPFLENFATGLTNLGNSCYMNCVLQCLGATPQLTSFFFPNVTKGGNQTLQSYRQHINAKNRLGTSGVLTTNFVKLLTSMFNNVGKYFAPHEFKKVIGTVPSGRQFASFDQQDCIEFLNFVLDSLHEDLNQRAVENGEERSAIMELSTEQEKTREMLPVRLASTIEWERYLKLNFSVIVDYFQGQYLSQLKCLECGMTSTTYNAFSILSLPIPERLNRDKVVTLAQCLDLFTDTELLDDDNKWHCPRCKRFTKLTKKISITRLPRVLIINFKRFQILMSGHFNKLETFVKYPVNETLDLTSYWPQVGTYVSKDHSMDTAKEQQILSTFPQRHQDPPFKYKLYGVVNHYGNLTTGHYTAYVKKASDLKQRKEWCYFDDAKILYDCKVDQVMNKSAYCLFFQRI